MLVLVLGLVENNDGHRVYDYNVQEDGVVNLQRGHGGGVFNTTMT